MDVIKTEADWYPELNANHKPVYLSTEPYIFANGGQGGG